MMMAINNYFTLEHQIFLGNSFFFGFPGNDFMFGMILLFIELFYLGATVICFIGEVIATIVTHFNSSKKKFPSQFTAEMESFIDIFFLLFPTAVILFILIPSLGFLYTEEMNSDSNFSMTITVTGHQWYWTYEIDMPVMNRLIFSDLSSHKNFEIHAILLDYENITGKTATPRLLGTDNVILFPHSTKILVQLSSDDVIHSWSIPQLGIKIDAIPGRVSSTVLYTDIEGTWYGQCSELCGVYHGFMPIHMHSTSKVYYFLWFFESEEFVLDMNTTIYKETDDNKFAPNHANAKANAKADTTILQALFDARFFAYAVALDYAKANALDLLFVNDHFTSAAIKLAFSYYKGNPLASVLFNDKSNGMYKVLELALTSVNGVLLLVFFLEFALPNFKNDYDDSWCWNHL
jgi:cytochrome c oxidase subunit 2